MNSLVHFRAASSQIRAPSSELVAGLDGGFPFVGCGATHSDYTFPSVTP